MISSKFFLFERRDFNYCDMQVDRKTGEPMVKLFEDKVGGREAEVVLDDPRSGTGIVSWFNGIQRCPFRYYDMYC